jgi:hypothetical protein
MLDESLHRLLVELDFLVCEGKALAVGTISTYKDGSKWKKQKSGKWVRLSGKSKTKPKPTKKPKVPVKTKVKVSTSGAAPEPTKKNKKPHVFKREKVFDDHAEGKVLDEREYNLMSQHALDNLTQDQRFAATNYSNHTDRILNPLLRKSKGQFDKNASLYEGSTDLAKAAKKRQKDDDRAVTLGQEIGDLDAAIASYKMPEKTKVFRVFADPTGEITKDFKVGGEFTDNGYVSTTRDKSIANNFYHTLQERTNRVNVVITIPKGKPALPSGGTSDYSTDEQEVLLPRGSKFKINRVTKGRGPDAAKTIEVELV